MSTYIRRGTLSLGEVAYKRNDIRFVWDRGKAESNLRKHGVSFETGCEIRGAFMKTQQLRDRLQKERPMATISIRMPEDVVEDLKRVAPVLGFSGYQPLIRAYIGQGLRQDLERLNRHPGIERLVESLRRQGVAEEVISSAIAEMRAT